MVKLASCLPRRGIPEADAAVGAGGRHSGPPWMVGHPQHGRLVAREPMLLALVSDAPEDGKMITSARSNLGAVRTEGHGSHPALMAGKVRDCAPLRQINQPD